MWDEDIVVDQKSNSTQAVEDQTAKKPILVIDTNAFIKCVDLKTLHDKYDLYTTAEVKYEIRDKKARDKFQALPFDILVKDPSKTAMAAVKKFAIATGDIATLSQVDMNVIALCYTFAEENQTSHLLRKQLPSIQEAFPQKQNIEDGVESLTLESQQANQNPEQAEQKDQNNNEDWEDEDNEKEQKKAAEDDEWNVVPVKEKKKQVKKVNAGFGTGWNFVEKKENKEVEKVEQKTEQSTEVKQAEESTSEKTEQKQNTEKKTKKVEDSDDEDDGQGWITSTNLHLYKEQGNSKNKIETDTIGISIMTADFAMQNVALQMGIPLVSVDGMLITRAKRFILECFSCLHLCREMTKTFCPNCGNHALLKVSCSFEADGTIKLFRKKDFKLNTNGFIYSIPKPKIGKEANNLVLREDELMKGNKLTQMKIAQKQSEKEFNRNMLEFENGFTLGDVKHKQHHNNDLDFGYGRINPNNVSQMKRNKRK